MTDQEFWDRALLAALPALQDYCNNGDISDEKLVSYVAAVADALLAERAKRACAAKPRLETVGWLCQNQYGVKRLVPFLDVADAYRLN